MSTPVSEPILSLLSDSPGSPASPTSSSSSDSYDSLPSSLDSTDSSSSDAEREWKESLQQIELLLTMVLIPYLGKYFGRRCAYWGWARWMHWMYPAVQVVVTDQAAFKGIGAVEAATSL
ncbi:MAG: hypothetical protein M1816_008034 [Peltula sp. TS41687]|nr:MAG: hypothetical protein M1816_008034 [Peltula sp. TS41687]